VEDKLLEARQDREAVNCMMDELPRTTKNVKEATRKHALANIAAEFPIRYDEHGEQLNGETEFKDVTEIAKLRYIPENLARHTKAYFEGLQIHAIAGVAHKIPLLNPPWVDFWFEKNFVAFVKHNSCSKDAPEDLFHFPIVKIAYQQKEHNTCLYRGFASALHALGEYELAGAVALNAKNYSYLPASEQLERLKQLVQKEYHYVSFEKKRRADSFDIFANKSDNPTVVIPLSADGGVSHALTVIDTYIFDSTQSKCLRLTKKTLDWCCDCKEGYSKVYKAVRFIKNGNRTPSIK